MKRPTVSTSVAAVAVMIMLQNVSFAQYQPGERVYTPPQFGTFWSVQPGATNMLLALPLPFFPFDPIDIPLYSITNTSFIFEFDWSQYSDLDSETGGQTENSLTGGYDPLFGTNDFWVEIVDATNGLCLLAAHNCKPTNYCQLQIKAALDQSTWTLGEVVLNDPPTNRLFFTLVPMTNSTLFFRAQEADLVVGVVKHSDALETNSACTDQGYPGIFEFTLNYGNGVSTNHTVSYTLTGTAINGTDYTNLPTSLIFTTNDFFVDLYVQPIDDHRIDFEEPVILTLSRTNGYIVNPTNFVATNWIYDNLCSNLFTVVATDIHFPAGIDYSPTTNALIVSVRYVVTQEDATNFIRIDTNATVTPWSGVRNIFDEKKIAIVHATAGGFTNGDLYFGTDVNGQIGRISADGTQWTTNWITLSTNSVGADALLRGGLYVDRTGIFGNNLIAVTGGNETEGGEVWKIDAQTNASLLVNITNTHLEGVITLPNDTSKWGPWAGKIITGAEAKLPPKIYAIDTNGTVISFDMDIEPEDFNIIPTNQALYCTAQQASLGGSSRIMKLSHTLLTNYWGDLLITQEGAVDLAHGPALFIVHWNSTSSLFEVHRISFYQAFEHCRFAPIDIPSTPDP